MAAAGTNGAQPSPLAPVRLITSSTLGGLAQGTPGPPWTPMHEPMHGGALQNFSNFSQSSRFPVTPEPGCAGNALQGCQLLRLPPCSPQKPLLLTDQAEDLHTVLIPYPDRVPHLGTQGGGDPSLPENGEDPENSGSEFMNDGTHPEDPFTYVDRKIFAVDQQIGGIQQYLANIAEALNNLREACANNEQSVLQKFDVFWNLVRKHFRHLLKIFRVVQMICQLIAKILMSLFPNICQKISANCRVMSYNVGMSQPNISRIGKENIREFRKSWMNISNIASNFIEVARNCPRNFPSPQPRIFQPRVMLPTPPWLGNNFAGECGY